MNRCDSEQGGGGWRLEGGVEEFKRSGVEERCMCEIWEEEKLSLEAIK